MKYRFFGVLGLLAFLALPAAVTSQGPSRVPAHNWDYLTFRPTNSAKTKGPGFLVGFGDKSNGLGVVVNELARKLLNETMTARLHRAAAIVEPIDTNLGMAISFDGSLWSVRGSFPWGDNSFDESWIEVSVGKERYWLEVPYGFDRDPKAPLPSSVRGGGPKSAAAIRALTERDHIVHWESLRYELGEIHDGWYLSVIQSNPNDSQTEVVLYRHRGELELNRPRTALRIRDESGLDRSARQVSRRVHDGELRRSDTFQIGRILSDTRGWGRIEIDVDGRSYEFIVPSSVYKYTHGHAPNSR